MAKLRPIATISLATLLCLTGPAAVPADQKWAWFAAISLQNKWHIVQGEATVRISKDGFFAELYDEESFLRITLKGKLRGGNIEAIAVRQETDDKPRKVGGKYKVVHWRTGGGRESIVLTESSAPWGLTIGLTRDLPSR